MSHVVHYGKRGYRASCGRAKPRRVSRLQKRVTCWRCKTTRHWRSRWWDQ